MSENNSGNMLLPLGLGAAGLILYMVMKKKQTTDGAAPAEDAAAILPPPAEVETAADQIAPTPAPSYTQAVMQTASNEVEQEDQEDTDEQGQEASEDEESDYEEDTPNTSSGSSYTPYTPVSTINPDQQQTASMPAIQITRNPARMVGKGKPSKKSAVLLKKQQEFNRQKKALRFQSDQARKLAQQQYTGNGKPKMTNSYRPGAIAVPTTAIAAKNPTALIPVVAKTAQSSIFPLKYGMANNPYVRELQRKIGVSATGHFNSLTRTALQKKYKVQEVSEPLYKQIITGKAPAAVKKPVPKLLNKIQKILPKRINVKRK